MLILARRPGERVVIGGDILVTVMEVSGSTVRLGIAAPAGVSIYREEIWLAVEAENRAAATADAHALPSEPVSKLLAESASDASARVAVTNVGDPTSDDTTASGATHEGPASHGPIHEDPAGENPTDEDPTESGGPAPSDA
jgi:carbon storage regulator